MTIKVLRDQSLPMRHIVHVRNHIVSTDGSVEEGGNDAGPSPHDLYDAALSACKALTVVWFAKRKNIPLEHVEVSMERCLLYTSPSPRDRQKSRMPSSA